MCAGPWCVTRTACRPWWESNPLHTETRGRLSEQWGGEERNSSTYGRYGAGRGFTYLPLEGLWLRGGKVTKYIYLRYTRSFRRTFEVPFFPFLEPAVLKKKHLFHSISEAKHSLYSTAVIWGLSYFLVLQCYYRTSTRAHKTWYNIARNAHCTWLTNSHTFTLRH